MPVNRPETPPSAPVKSWKEIKMSGPVSTIRNRMFNPRAPSRPLSRRTAVAGALLSGSPHPLHAPVLIIPHFVI
jgi:hypothetical protein